MFEVPARVILHTASRVRPVQYSSVLYPSSHLVDRSYDSAGGQVVMGMKVRMMKGHTSFERETDRLTGVNQQGYDHLIVFSVGGYIMKIWESQIDEYSLVGVAIFQRHDLDVITATFSIALSGS